ncbi:MAG: hypothetical protein BMS9Abin31_0483 [Gammaproteobacteria bacterium]|nr:MAG: hypothetical protein BMS9Abin31_0483 [Gammaproteobacteria bacterium]
MKYYNESKKKAIEFLKGRRECSEWDRERNRFNHVIRVLNASIETPEQSKPGVVINPESCGDRNSDYISDADRLSENFSKRWRLE